MALVRLAISSYSSSEGIGLFAGVTRYGILEGRLRLAAVQARTLRDFWSILLRSMRWPVTPKRLDDAILTLLSAGDDLAVLRALATQTPAIVMIARRWHDDVKAVRHVATPLDESDLTANLFDEEDR